MCVCVCVCVCARATCVCEGSQTGVVNEYTECEATSETPVYAEPSHPTTGGRDRLLSTSPPHTTLKSSPAASDHEYSQLHATETNICMDNPGYALTQPLASKVCLLTLFVVKLAANNYHFCCLQSHYESAVYVPTKVVCSFNVYFAVYSFAVGATRAAY